MKASPIVLRLKPVWMLVEAGVYPLCKESVGVAVVLANMRCSRDA